MVLDSLDRGQSLRDLNLRGIARELGCAHTNAYNWFPRQEDLYWQALGEAIQRLVRPYENLAPEDIPHPLGENSLFEGYIRYAFAHPAWFRLIWQEILEPPPPPDLPPVLDRPRRIMGAWLRYHVGPAMPEGELEERARILTGCLQGELGALVSNRIDPAAKENTPEEIASRVRRLYRLLFGALQPVAADAEPGTEIAAGSGPA
jgi:AcrR family transcriptional regulator